LTGEISPIPPLIGKPGRTLWFKMIRENEI
jgi:hypothetical protein